MKFLRWIIRLKCDPGRFYKPLSGAPYLAGMGYEDKDAELLTPIWDVAPVLYNYRAARFQRSELRRVGYNVQALPWLFYSFRCFLDKRKKRIWK